MSGNIDVTGGVGRYDGFSNDGIHGNAEGLAALKNCFGNASVNPYQAKAEVGPQDAPKGGSRIGALFSKLGEGVKSTVNSFKQLASAIGMGSVFSKAAAKEKDAGEPKWRHTEAESPLGALDRMCKEIGKSLMRNLSYILPRTY